MRVRIELNQINLSIQLELQRFVGMIDVLKGATDLQRPQQRHADVRCCGRENAALASFVNRRLFRFQDIKQRRVPGTPIQYRPTPVDKKILDDDKDFSFAQTVIPPHSSASGFLFYDIKDIDEPALKGAELYVKMIHTKDAKDTELFGFSVLFDKYLAAEKSARYAAKSNASDKPDSSKDKDKQ